MWFCQSTINREAPTSRVWRVMVPGSSDECSTQIFTIRVDAKEEWKLLPDDEILLGEGKGSTSVKDTTGKFIENGHKGHDDDVAVELGDDFAEEGRLGRREPRTAYGRHWRVIG
jgi:hypothetical protein